MTDSSFLAAAAEPIQDSPAESGGGIVAVPPGAPPQLSNPSAAEDGDPSLYGPIAAALVGAFAAQWLAAQVNFKLRSRTEQVDAFDRAFTTGMAARKAMASYRRIAQQSVPQWPAYYELTAAVTEFRAAELHYRAQFGGDDGDVDQALAAALQAVESWATPEISDVELEQRQEEALQDLAEHDPVDHVLGLREELRVDGQQLEDQLNAAIAAFGDATRRSRRRVLPWP